MQHVLKTTMSRFAAFALMALPLAAAAQQDPGGPPGTIPEPGTWSLVGLGLVVAVIIARKGRK